MLFKRLLTAAALSALHPNIVGGSASDASQDSAILLIHLSADGKTRNLCTASLVAPRLILTARHCVIDTPDPDTTVGCLADGRPVSGPTIRGDVAATDLYVFAGRDRTPSTRPLIAADLTKWKPTSRGARIFDDGSTTLCDHDLALVLLDTPIRDVPIAKLRLESDITVGESVVAVGYGITLDELEPPTRQQRGGVVVRFSGPHDSTPYLTKNELGYGASICSGDSGGPLLSESGAVIAVISRGDPFCPTASNIATKVRPFRALINDAFNAAGATPQLEDWDSGGGCL